jgi:hypothetical protein
MELVQKTKERQAVFLLCENCFWTASAIDREGYELVMCPACAQKRLSSIPIATNESYSYSFSQTGSLDVCFSAKAVP